DTDDMSLPDLEVGRVFELAAADLDCPDLGLRMARRQDLGVLGPLSLAVRNSSTFADAMDCTTRYLVAHERSFSIAFAEDPYGTPGVAALRYGVHHTESAVHVQAVDLAVAFIHRAIELLVGPYGLRSVELPYSPPGPESVYTEFFRAPVRFNRPWAMLRVPVSLGTQPIDASNPHLRQLALAYLAEETPKGHTDLALRVRESLARTLDTPDITRVSAELNLHPRTLQRELRKQGTSFSGLLDDVRRKAARRYLTGTDLPLSQVAGLLGLSEQSALTRCCRRWWNATPSEVWLAAPVSR
ncbi:AraC family transcriptional regulator, partial [Kibdelosporangium lantanae]